MASRAHSSPAQAHSIPCSRQRFTLAPLHATHPRPRPPNWPAILVARPVPLYPPWEAHSRPSLAGLDLRWSEIAARPVSERRCFQFFLLAVPFGPAESPPCPNPAQTPTGSLRGFLRRILFNIRKADG